MTPVLYFIFFFHNDHSKPRIAQILLTGKCVSGWFAVLIILYFDLIKLSYPLGTPFSSDF